MKNAPILIANWKMHKGCRDAESFIEQLLPHLKATQAWVGIAPAFPVIAAAAQAAKGSHLHIGAQTMSEHDHGAFTGEVAASMLKEVGASFVLIGHSERRQLFHESDALIHKKLKQAIKEGIRPVLCVGETLEERNLGHTEDVLERQLVGALEHLGDCPGLFVAYEPVWAIGTGKVATPEMAQETHEVCRSILSRFIKGRVPILYGGSVKPDNAQTLLKQPDIDGALIGGASLDVNSFIKMITD